MILKFNGCYSLLWFSVNGLQFKKKMYITNGIIKG